MFYASVLISLFILIYLLLEFLTYRRLIITLEDMQQGAMTPLYYVFAKRKYKLNDYELMLNYRYRKLNREKAQWATRKWVNLFIATVGFSLAGVLMGLSQFK